MHSWSCNRCYHYHSEDRLAILPFTCFRAGCLSVAIGDITVEHSNYVSGVNLNTQRGALITLFNQGGRGAVLYRLADDDLVLNSGL